jgi:hypothetical protein
MSPEIQSQFTLNVVQTPIGTAAGEGNWGQSFIRCQNCRYLTNGASVLSDRLDSIRFSNEWFTASSANRPDLVVPQR